MAKLTKRQCNCCKGMPICDCSHAEAEPLKFAIIEYLAHRGEQPHRILRSGHALWETHIKAMRAGINAYNAALSEANAAPIPPQDPSGVISDPLSSGDSEMQGRLPRGEEFVPEQR